MEMNGKGKVVSGNFPTFYMNDPAVNEVFTIADILRLAKQRPIFGQDYLGPAGYGDADMEQYYDATPYEQGRSIPPRLSDLLQTDMDMQDYAGADPYGNPLPPTWAQRRMRR